MDVVTKGGERELPDGMDGVENKQLERTGGKRGEGTGEEAPIRGQNLHHQRGRLEVITCRMNKECILHQNRTSPTHVDHMHEAISCKLCNPADSMKPGPPLSHQTQNGLDMK